MSHHETDHPFAADLELGPDAMRRLVDRAMERIVEHVSSLAAQPVSDVSGAEQLARSLRAPLPERGRPLDEVLSLVFDRALSKSYNTASPGYLAFIPGGGLFQTAVADLISASVNRYSGVWIAAPGLVAIETNVLTWLRELVGLPETGTGLLTSGGSLASLIALVTARTERLGESFADGRIYLSDQIHHCVPKAARIAGFPAASLRPVPTDGALRMRPDALARAIEEDQSAGARPFLVVASAGTANTGAVDDLAALADVCDRHGLWLHVDAAYGGFFLLTERGRAVLRGIGRADSIVLDPHKGLFLPYGSGCLLVRDQGALRRAHGVTGDYMPPMQESAERVDFCDLSPELSRPWRGLSVWLPLMLHGVSTFRRYLDEKLDLARMAHERLAARDDVEIVAPPSLSLFAFRVRRPGLAEEAENSLNRRVLDAVNRRQRVFLTGTTLGGRFVLRICVLSFRTHRERLEMALSDIDAAIASVS
ncbi:MAG: aminotransferase class I/II-fold pyridoxal phosphate-dependent enzyme [Acidobacteriota bacterium]|nr:aminotransferase class I/II-fold pyridoxal phosphate-dependent enzyme [Acidobacteriota bacterium]